MDKLNLDIPTLINDYAMPWGIKIALALVIFIIGRIIVSMVVTGVRKLLTARGMDDILVSFLTSILRWVLLLFVIIAALSQLGVDTTSLVALLGAAGLAIGLSLQSSLSNFASGVMLIIFRPFTKGNFVEVAGTSGVVDQISIFTTTLTTPDNKEVIVPNGAIIDNNITNYSARDTRRVDMVFGIGYDDDLRKAKQLLEEIVAADDRILPEPAPVVALSELLMPCRREPRDVTEQVDAAGVPVRRDAEPRARAVPVQLTLADDLAQRRGVQQPAQLAGTELPRVNRHAFLPMTSPSRATPRSARG